MYHLEHLPHTADICLRIEADTLEELFLGALRGMSDFLQPEACRKNGTASVITSIKTESVDRTALLIDFLNDVLTAIFAHRAVFCEVHFLSLTETDVQAVIKGHPVEEFADDIKAVTYHDADVRRNDQGKWETLVIFDI